MRLFKGQIKSVTNEQSQNEQLKRLFTEFVRLRQNNHAPEEAWRMTQSQAVLDRQTRRHLAAMIQLWETRNGHHYKASEKTDINTTAVFPAIRTSPKPAEVTEPKRPDAAIFSDQTTLLLDIPKHPIRVKIADGQEIILGRAAPASIIGPDIDLSEFSEYGISRIHATLRRQEKTLYVADLGSRHHTFLNGEQLVPNQLYPLKHGDELRLGTLAARVRFERVSLSV
ncbi:MAG: hypothetical protein CUN55_13735 [Phototrophicales bacterium]|nr:MAG: hypothetical protein CUN55_13735 [Phototrophicales bacterium]